MRPEFVPPARSAARIYQTFPLVTPEPRIDTELVRPGQERAPAHELHRPERENGGCLGTCAHHERLLDAIREHRAATKPSAWTERDRKLYGLLPEVTW